MLWWLLETKLLSERYKCITTDLHLARPLCWGSTAAACLSTLSVWVGLSIFAVMANKRLARSSQAVLCCAGGWALLLHRAPSAVGGLRATYIFMCKCGWVLGVSLKASFRVFTCWFFGRRRGVQPWQWPLMCFNEIPRQAGRKQAGRLRFPLTHYGHRENGQTGEWNQYRKDGNDAQRWNTPSEKLLRTVMWGNKAIHIKKHLHSNGWTTSCVDFYIKFNNMDSLLRCMQFILN